MTLHKMDTALHHHPSLLIRVGHIPLTSLPVFCGLSIISERVAFLCCYYCGAVLSLESAFTKAEAFPAASVILLHHPFLSTAAKKAEEIAGSSLSENTFN